MWRAGILLLLAVSAAAQDVEALKELAPSFDTATGNGPDSVRIDAVTVDLCVYRVAYDRGRGSLVVWNPLDGCPIVVACGKRAVFCDVLGGEVRLVEGVVPDFEYFQDGDAFRMAFMLSTPDETGSSRIRLDVRSVMSFCETLELRGPDLDMVRIAGRSRRGNLFVAWVDPDKSPAYRRVALIKRMRFPPDDKGTRVEVRLCAASPADFPEVPGFEALAKDVPVTRIVEPSIDEMKALAGRLMASLVVSRGLVRDDERADAESSLSLRIKWGELDAPYAKIRKALIARFGRGPRAGHFERAKDAFDADRFDAARPGFERALKHGDTRALTFLGMIALRDGDAEQAEAYFLRAAEKEYAHGQLALALLLERRGDAEQAATWYRRAAESGHVDAAARLGSAYRYGHGVPKDLEAAVRWYTVAAEAGDADAQCALGTVLLHGKGVARDYPAAVKWYTKAAEQGHAEAQLLLGICHFTGRGVEKDQAKAAFRFRQAGEQGNAVAQRFLGMMYLAGDGVEKDVDAGVRWLEAAAKQGLPEACVYLAGVYEKGEDVARNPVRAHALYTVGGEEAEAARLAKELTPAQLEESARVQKRFRPAK